MSRAPLGDSAFKCLAEQLVPEIGEVSLDLKVLRMALILKRWQRGAVMSFLYVEDLEVRHEVLARLRDLEAFLDGLVHCKE